MSDWVKTGGIIIVEAQTAAWKLVQDSYYIFSKHFPIKTTEKRKTGISAKINKKKNQHPILIGLKEKIDLPDVGSFQKTWFPSACNICSIRSNERRKLYQGYFDRYSKEWEPLMFEGSSNKKPIMLCRAVKGKINEDGNFKFGGYILTTMYIGSSSLNTLITNLLSLGNKMDSYYKTKEIEEKNNAKKKFSITLFILFILIIFYFKLPLLINYIPKSMIDTLKDILKDILVVAVGGTIYTQIVPFIKTKFTSVKYEE